MYVGQLFDSYSEFETALRAFEKENFVCFSKRDSRKIESARRKIKYPLKPELKFYEVKFNCIRGGPLRHKGKGKRKASTIKIDCPSHISLRATPDGKNLQIRSLNVGHNHEITGGEQLRNKRKQLNYRTKDKTVTINDIRKKTIKGDGPPRALTGREKRVLNLIGKSSYEGILPTSYDSTSFLLEGNKSAENYTATHPGSECSSTQVVTDNDFGILNSENQQFDDIEEILQQSTIAENDCVKETSQHKKRKSDFSTPRVKKMREKRKKEEEKNEMQLRNELVENKRLIVENVKSMNEKLETIAANQEKLLTAYNKTNEFLQNISQNIRNMLRICTTATGIELQET